MAATVAFVHVAAQFLGPAYLYGTHSPELIARKLMGFYVLGAMLTEYVRHLNPV